MGTNVATRTRGRPVRRRVILGNPTDPDGKSRRKAATAVRTDATGRNLKVRTLSRPTYTAYMRCKTIQYVV